MANDTSKDITQPEPETTPEPKQETQTLKRPEAKHKHRLLKIIVAVLAFLIIPPLLFAAWLGFVPGLSDLLGARTAKDLGVERSEADFESYKTKTSTTFNDFANAPDNPARPGKKTVFADPKTVEDLKLTQEEITAAINSLGWAWLPAENVQVRLTDNTVEVSGNLKLEYVEEFVNFIGGVGYSSEDVSTASDWGRRFVDGGAFYAKGNASVTNDQLSLSLTDIQIGRYNVPMETASTVICTGGSNGINNAQHLEVNSATVGDGELKFTGTYPTTIYVKR